MDIRDLSTVELLSLILGGFNEEFNTDEALDAYLFAKKVSNAAAVALKLTGDFAVQQLVEKGGKGANSFASYSITKSWQKTFEPDENREAAIAEIEAQHEITKAIAERLAQIEKEMEKAGRIEKKEVGQNIKVTLLEKI